ncbi:hypothetical protein MKEN_01153300 [Mycena kentingensis (nom. inval.)]|nr:hypothetical protein MKEN_01153300 [Mycena kentingensis (nom. inval.)]
MWYFEAEAFGPKETCSGFPQPNARRSGRVFADFFQSPVFSIRGPLAAAVNAKGDEQEDAEPDDLIPDPQETDVDDIPAPYPAPSVELDLDDPVPSPPTGTKRKHRPHSPFVITTDLAVPPSGGHAGRAHRYRAKKRAAKVAAEGHRTHTEAENRGSKKRRGLEEFFRMGFTKLAWNGIDAKPLVDSSGRIFAVLAGRPTTPAYSASTLRALRLLRAAAAHAAAHSVGKANRRGPFTAVTVGISYGQGQTSATPLSSQNPELAQQLADDQAFQHIASFGSSMLAFWAPNLYEYYRKHNEKLDPKLTQPRPFPRSVFASATFNLGPNVWTFRHRDVLNLPFGWCAITALGEYDPSKGGHLVLWDLKLVIEFPPGSTILIPSATLAHSNIPVSPEEYRASFTQYTAGGLFRYVDNDFQTEAELASSNPAKFHDNAVEKEKRGKYYTS